VAAIMPAMVMEATLGAVSGEKPAGTLSALRIAMARATSTAVATTARAEPTTTSRRRLSR
jgi:hypothetical protein